MRRRVPALWHGPGDDGVTTRRLLLLLHGSGSDERQLADAADAVDPAAGFLVVTPRAPLARRGGASSWFRTSRVSGIDPETLDDALGPLGLLVLEVCDRENLDPAATVVGGFSQGGVIAFALATRSRAEWRPAAVWSLCGALVPETVGALAFDPRLLVGVPVLFQYASEDPLVAESDSQRGIARLRSVGAVLTAVSYATGHEVSPPALADATAWLGTTARNGSAP